jgi:hypothetical protein|tara:strand:+ start:107 stop:358 length:252 start_codon:yes stop_codon:yes gene_type:complete
MFYRVKYFYYIICKQLKTVKKVIMGIISKQKTTIEKKSEDFNSAELDILLKLIKNSTFSGDTIEVLYNLIIKLQKKYQLTKDK